MVFIFCHISFISLVTVLSLYSTTGTPFTKASVIILSKWILPIIGILFFRHQSSILDEFSKLISYLFIITAVFIPKCWATFYALSK